MSNYVSKEVAVKLKEAGFDVFTNGRYTSTGIFRCDNQRMNWNRIPTEFSAPDFLTAADWFFPNHSLEFIFQIYRTKIFSHITGEYIGNFGSGSVDHRNEALLFALNLIKTKA